MKKGFLMLITVAQIFVGAVGHAQDGSSSAIHGESLVSEGSHEDSTIKLEKDLSKRIALGKNGQKTEFTRDTSNPKLGDAWKDPTGMIWGDIVTAKQGKDFCDAIFENKCIMRFSQAFSYCESIGAKLPSKEDFQRLTSYMGATENSDDGYQPQALPNLYYRTKNGNIRSNYFWSFDANFSHNGYDFDGYGGTISFINRDYTHSRTVRCVGVHR